MLRFLAARGVAEFLLVALLVVVVAVAEETIFRGYLILHFTAITGSPAAAVVLSAIVFSLGHGYDGTAAVAPMVMHSLQDCIGIVVVPLLQQW